MITKSALIVILSCLYFVLSASLTAKAQGSVETINQLTSELRNSGEITQGESAAIKSSLEHMADQGIAKKDLKDIVVELAQNGARGNNLRLSLDSVSDLINRGESPTDARSLVAQAAAQAHAQGLKGKDFMNRIYDTVKQRQDQNVRQTKMKPMTHNTMDMAPNTKKKTSMDMERNSMDMDN